MLRIADNVYVETDMAGCCNHSFVATSGGVVMIDTPAAAKAAAIWRKTADSHGPVRYLIDTEPHIDHFGGNYFFSTTIVAHEGAAPEIAGGSVEELVQLLSKATPDDLPLPEGFFFPAPEITFSERLSMRLGRHLFQLMHLPGHTPYQTVVYVAQERTIFTGDNVVNKTMPFLGQSLPYEWLDSLKRMEELDIEYVVPGHGAVGDKGLIGRMRRAVEEAIETVRDGIRQGMTLKEAKDRITLFRDYADFITNPQLTRWLSRVNVGRLYELVGNDG